MSNATTNVNPNDFRAMVQRMENEFLAALPPQIDVSKFTRTLMTSVQMNPELLQADRKSLLSACMKAAQDGLLLDGREAALVCYNARDRAGQFVKMAQYMPMVSGILKKVRQSGELLVGNIFAALGQQQIEDDRRNAGRDHDAKQNHAPDQRAPEAPDARGFGWRERGRRRGFGSHRQFVHDRPILGKDNAIAALMGSHHANCNLGRARSTKNSTTAPLSRFQPMPWMKAAP